MALNMQAPDPIDPLNRGKKKQRPFLSLTELETSAPSIHGVDIGTVTKAPEEGQRPAWMAIPDALSGASRSLGAFTFGNVLEQDNRASLTGQYDIDKRLVNKLLTSPSLAPSLRSQPLSIEWAKNTAPGEVLNAYVSSNDFLTAFDSDPVGLPQRDGTVIPIMSWSDYAKSNNIKPDDMNARAAFFISYMLDKNRPDVDEETATRIAEMQKQYPNTAMGKASRAFDVGKSFLGAVGTGILSDLASIPGALEMQERGKRVQTNLENLIRQYDENAARGMTDEQQAPLIARIKSLSSEYQQLYTAVYRGLDPTAAATMGGYLLGAGIVGVGNRIVSAARAARYAGTAGFAARAVVRLADMKASQVLSRVGLNTDSSNKLVRFAANKAVDASRIATRGIGGGTAAAIENGITEYSRAVMMGKDEEMAASLGQEAVQFGFLFGGSLGTLWGFKPNKWQEVRLPDGSFKRVELGPAGSVTTPAGTAAAAQELEGEARRRVLERGSGGGARIEVTDAGAVKIRTDNFNSVVAQVDRKASVDELVKRMRLDPEKGPVRAQILKYYKDIGYEAITGTTQFKNLLDELEAKFTGQGDWLAIPKNLDIDIDGTGTPRKVPVNKIPTATLAAQFELPSTTTSQAAAALRELFDRANSQDPRIAGPARAALEAFKTPEMAPIFSRLRLDPATGGYIPKTVAEAAEEAARVAQKEADEASAAARTAAAKEHEEWFTEFFGLNKPDVNAGDELEKQLRKLMGLDDEPPTPPPAGPPPEGPPPTPPIDDNGGGGGGGGTPTPAVLPQQLDLFAQQAAGQATQTPSPQPQGQQLSLAMPTAVPKSRPISYNDLPPGTPVLNLGAPASILEKLYPPGPQRPRNSRWREATLAGGTPQKTVEDEIKDLINSLIGKIGTTETVDGEMFTWSPTSVFSTILAHLDSIGFSPGTTKFLMNPDGSVIATTAERWAGELFIKTIKDAALGENPSVTVEQARRAIVRMTNSPAPKSMPQILAEGGQVDRFRLQSGRLTEVLNGVVGGIARTRASMTYLRDVIRNRFNQVIAPNGREVTGLVKVDDEGTTVRLRPTPNANGLVVVNPVRGNSDAPTKQQLAPILTMADDDGVPLEVHLSVDSPGGRRFAAINRGTDVQMDPAKFVARIPASIFNQVASGKQPGGTFNLDGSSYRGSGHAVAVYSLNIDVADFTPANLQKFLENNRKLIASNDLKIGMYVINASGNSPAKVALDLTVVTPTGQGDLAMEIAARLRQESVWDFDGQKLNIALELDRVLDSGLNILLTGGHENYRSWSRAMIKAYGPSVRPFLVETYKRLRERRAQGNDDVRRVKLDYLAKNPRTLSSGKPAVPVLHIPEYRKVNEQLNSRIARAYEDMPVDAVNKPIPGKTAAESSAINARTKASYDALMRETNAQFEMIIQAGYKVEFVDGNPYANSSEMMADVRKNKRLKVQLTGDDFYHPYMTRQETHIFRAVHDFFGHAAEGLEFGARGEDNALVRHATMFTSEAVPALVTETRGQNSYVNFGPNRNIPAAERPYAVQKAALLPEWAYEDVLKLAIDADRRSGIDPVKMTPRQVAVAVGDAASAGLGPQRALSLDIPDDPTSLEFMLDNGFEYIGTTRAGRIIFRREPRAWRGVRPAQRPYRE